MANNVQAGRNTWSTRCAAAWNVHVCMQDVCHGLYSMSSDLNLFVQELVFAVLCLFDSTLSGAAFAHISFFFFARTIVHVNLDGITSTQHIGGTSCLFVNQMTRGRSCTKSVLSTLTWFNVIAHALDVLGAAVGGTRKSEIKKEPVTQVR